MAERLHPGVYVEEVSSGVRPIEAVGTSTAAFVGEAARGMPGAQFLTSFDEYVRLFGGHSPGDKGLLALAVQAFFAAGGRRAYVVRVLPSSAVAGASANLATRFTAAHTVGLQPLALAFSAKGKGAWADAIRIEIAEATHFPDEAFKVVVSWVENGASRVVEAFDDVRMDPRHEDYVGEALKSSKYIEVKDLFQEDKDSQAPAFATIPEEEPFVALKLSGVTDKYSIPEGGELTFQWSDAASDATPRTTKVTFGASIAGDKTAQELGAFLKNAFSAGGNHFVVSPDPSVVDGPYRISARAATRSRMAIEPKALPVQTVNLTDWTIKVRAGSVESTLSFAGVPDITAVTMAQVSAAIEAAFPNVERTLKDTRLVVVGERSANDATLSVTQTWGGGGPAPADPFAVANTKIGIAGELIDNLDGVTMTITEKRKPGVASMLAGLGLSAKTRGYQEGSAANPVVRPVEVSGFKLLLGSDGPANAVLGPNDYKGSAAELTGLHALDPEEVNLVNLPGKNDPAFVTMAMEYVDGRGDCFLLVDGPGGSDPKFDIPASEAKQIVQGLPNRSNNSAMYYPWIRVSDPVGIGKSPTRYVPPAAHMAGIYARTDNTRGVWKAPAGLEAVVTGALDLQGHPLLDADQDLLNPVSLNCLRKFPGSGIVAWGARTLSSDPEWRYVPVRRTALFLKESLRRGLRWAVFEPNDQELWDQISSNISSFMLGLFRQGAFQGTTPDEAFRVRCDRSTNPQTLVDQGIVTAQVAFAPLKPAEFVVIEISQKALVS